LWIDINGNGLPENKEMPAGSQASQLLIRIYLTHHMLFLISIKPASHPVSDVDSQIETAIIA
jgi:hypothetical protein